jgi:hypothetical protein
VAVGLGAALVVATVPARSAAATPSRLDRSAVVSVGTPAAARSVRGQTSIGATCETVGAYRRALPRYSLNRLTDTAPLSSAQDTMTETRQVGSGWYDRTFRWVASGGDGIVYGLTWTGDLKWYRYNDAKSDWVPGSGRVVGTGFTRNRVITIALGAGGDFYVVRSDRALVLYRHTGRLSGTPSWARPSGWVIGSGWTGAQVVIPNGDGTVYRQHGGTLDWYRHTDPASAPVAWSGPRTIGTGWTFYDVRSAGAGVLYAATEVPGYANTDTLSQVRVYRHTDPVGGGASWGSATGVRKFTGGWMTYGSVAIDPDSCTLN